VFTISSAARACRGNPKFLQIPRISSFAPWDSGENGPPSDWRRRRKAVSDPPKVEILHFFAPPVRETLPSKHYLTESPLFVRCCDREFHIEIGDSYEDYRPAPNDACQFARSPIRSHVD
jgi:hypothetical protein